MNYRCLWCNAETVARTFWATERLFGMEGRWEYAECASCGSLQMLVPPDDLSRFYPPEYDAYNTLPHTYYRGWKGLLRRWRDYHVVTGRGVLGRVVLWFHPQQDPRVRSVRLLSLHPGARILDVGCGNGLLLLILYHAGFRCIEGLDPYAPLSDLLNGRIAIHRRTLAEHVADQPAPYDAIMFHHVLEHVRSPAEELMLAKRMLKPGGKILVRLPLAGSYHWRHYGTDWFQLDAPRHLSIPSREGMRRIAALCGLKIEHEGFDALALHLHASELYRRGVVGMKHRAEMHSPQRWKQFEWLTEQLNRSGDSDSGVFVLSRAEGEV